MKPEAASSRWNRNLVLAAAGILLIVLAACFTRRNPQGLTGPAAELKQMLDAEEEVVGIYNQAQQAYTDGKIDAQTFVDIIKSEVLAPWREAQSRLRQADTSRLTEKGIKLYESLLRAMKLREQAWGLVIDSLREDSKEGMDKAAEKGAEADRIEAEILAEFDIAENEPEK